jgi:hypothetical protein
MITILKRRNARSLRIDQGDIYENIMFFRNYKVVKKQVKIDYWEFNKVLVLSQTCDLHREQEKDKKNYSGKILSVLVVPLFKLTDYTNGNHLEAVGITEKEKDKGVIKKLIEDTVERCYLIRLTFDEKVTTN